MDIKRRQKIIYSKLVERHADLGPIYPDTRSISQKAKVKDLYSEAIRKMPDIEIFTEYNKNFFLREKSDYVFYHGVNDLDPCVDNDTISTADKWRNEYTENLIYGATSIRECEVNLIFYERKDYAPEFELEERYYFEDLGREVLGSADQKAARRYDRLIACMREELETPNDHNFEATEEAYNFLHRTEEEEIRYRKKSIGKPPSLLHI